MKFQQVPPSHQRNLTIVGIDPNGDVWSFGTADPFRADRVLQQMKKCYEAVILLETDARHQT